MTTCPNCSHANPQGATQCEACFTPLPATTNCPSCGATIQMDAVFCGQCGTNVKAAVNEPVVPIAPPPTTESALPPTIIAGANPTPPAFVPEPEPIPAAVEVFVPTAPVMQPPMPEPMVEPVAAVLPVVPEPVIATPDPAITNVPTETRLPSKTQLQLQRFQLSHIQSGTVIDIPTNLEVIHIGKPNEQVPPDIDVSGFPCSEVVSRFHADIRVDGDSLYIEDIGSANGTYVNHNVLPKGNRHLLRAGDRISLGKGDLVTFLFQVM
jgi:FHA domain/Double zinc ribbon